MRNNGPGLLYREGMVWDALRHGLKRFQTRVAPTKVPRGMELLPKLRFCAKRVISSTNS